MKYVLYGALLMGFVALIYTTVLFSFYPLKYKTEIRTIAEFYDVNSALIASVINAESGYHPNAVSNKGAVGLMQVIPSTAEWVASKIGIDFSIDALKHPRTNILIGTYYLKYLLDKFRDTKTALIAYNAGEGNVQNWLGNTAYLAKDSENAVLKSCPFPGTNKYVEKVLNGIKFYKHRF